jgi:hypothetical protein
MNAIPFDNRQLMALQTLLGGDPSFVPTMDDILSALKTAVAVKKARGGVTLSMSASSRMRYNPLVADAERRAVDSVLRTNS